MASAFYHSELPPESWEPTPESILEVAQIAVRVVFRRFFILERYLYEDFEDACQTAACEVWRQLAGRNRDNRVYAYKVARNAVYDWLRENYTSIRPLTRPFREYEERSICDNREHDDCQPDIDRLQAQAAEVGLTPQLTAYLLYRMQGYTTVGIAHELSTTVHAVECWRSRLLSRLRKHVGEPDPPKYVHLNDEEHQQVEAWRQEGLSWYEIARRLQRTRTVIMRWHQRWCDARSIATSV